MLLPKKLLNVGFYLQKYPVGVRVLSVSVLTTPYKWISIHKNAEPTVPETGLLNSTFELQTWGVLIAIIAAWTDYLYGQWALQIFLEVAIPINIECMQLIILFIQIRIIIGLVVTLSRCYARKPYMCITSSRTVDGGRGENWGNLPWAPLCKGPCYIIKRNWNTLIEQLPNYIQQSERYSVDNYTEIKLLKLLSHSISEV